MSDRDTLLGLLSEPAETDSMETPAIFAGRYRVLSLVGAGGMGAVYRVRDEKLGEVVALKLLRGAGPEIAARLRSEVVLARKVTHPNVVRTFDLGEDGDQLFLTMEYVPGTSLGTVLRTTGPLAPNRALAIGRQLASAVAAAHAAGVLHRDLKPDNVLIAEDGQRVVLTDFGIAQVVAGGPKLWAGTPAWMAPEQREGGPATPRSEVWALGAILYEALTGERASEGVDPSRLPAGFDRVLVRCLDDDPVRRYADPTHLDAALAEVAAISQAPAATPLAAPGERVLQVRPLRIVGPPEAAYLAEGLTEELTDALAASPGLTVIAGEGADGHAEARVEGVLRWAGAGPLRVRTHLIGTDGDLRIWSKKVSCAAEELLDLGELFAREIAEALTVNRPSRALSAISSDAATQYLRARALIRETWDSDLAPAARLLIGTLERHPDSPALLSLLAVVRSRQAFFASNGDQRLYAQARAAAVRAIGADPSRGEPWMALGQTLIYEGRTALGSAALRRAGTLAPGSADIHRLLGYLLLEAGRIDASLPHLRVAVAGDQVASATVVLGRAHAYRGDLARACQLARGLGPNQYFDRAYMLARWWLWGHHAVRDEALEAIGAAIGTTYPDMRDLPEIASGLLALHAMLRGDHIPEARAVEAVEAIRAGAGGRLLSGRGQFVCEFATFCGYPESALEALEMSVEAGLEDILWMDQCPVLAPLRGDPRFAAARAVVSSRSAAILAALDGDPEAEAALDALVG